MCCIGVRDTAQQTHAHNLLGTPPCRWRIAACEWHAVRKATRRDTRGKGLDAAHRPPPYHVPKLRGALVPQPVQHVHLGSELAQLGMEEPVALAQDDERGWPFGHR